MAEALERLGVLVETTGSSTEQRLTLRNTAGGSFTLTDGTNTTVLCDKALERGVYVQGIRYPSVPRGSARLRFTPTADHSSADIARVVDLFSELR